MNAIRRIFATRGMGQALTAMIGLIVLCTIFSILNPIFISDRNVSNLLRQIAPVLIIGIGQSFVLITGNIDLSIGSVVGMSCMISATLMTKGLNPWLAAAATLVCGLGAGFVNGQLVARFRLPPFIATLGTMTIARGVAQIVNNNYNTKSIGDAAQLFRDFFYYGRFAGAFSTVWIALVLWLAFNFILGRTRTGRHIYAVGSNIEATRMSGVDVLSTVTKAYLVSAFCATVVGLVTCATSGMGTMDAGNMYEMYAVAAGVIGGISPLGGTGLLLGTFAGAAVWQTLENGLNMVGAQVGLQRIVIGVIVVFSVLLDVVIRRGARKRSK